MNSIKLLCSYHVYLFSLCSDSNIQLVAQVRLSSAMAGCTTRSGRRPAAAEVAAVLGTLRGAGEGTNAGTTNKAATKRRGRKELRAMVLKLAFMKSICIEAVSFVCFVQTQAEREQQGGSQKTQLALSVEAIEMRQLLLEVYQLESPMAAASKQVKAHIQFGAERTKCATNLRYQTFVPLRSLCQAPLFLAVHFRLTLSARN